LFFDQIRQIRNEADFLDPIFEIFPKGYLKRLRPWTLFLIGVLCFAFSARAALGASAPVGPNFFPAYKAVPKPFVDSSPQSAKPIGFGYIASGGFVFDLAIETEDYSRPVDAYVGIAAPVFFGADILLATETGGFQMLSQGVVPWKRSTTRVAGSILTGLAASLFPTSQYTVILLTVPAGTPESSLTSNYHLWTSDLSVFHVEDVERRALGHFSDQNEAGDAILNALEKGKSLAEIVAAVMAGALSASGDIQLSASENGTASIRVASEAEALVRMILSLADMGYSAAQIRNLITNMVIGITDVRYDGGWIKDCTQDPCQIVRPAIIPPGLFAVSSRTWLDFDFSAVKECYLDGKIRVEGYPLTDGYALLGSHLFLSGGLTPVQIPFETESGQDLIIDRYGLEFQTSHSAFYHTYYYAMQGDVHHFGASVDFITGFKSYADAKPGELKGATVADIRSLPFVSIAEKSGRPCITYGLSGAAACDFVEALKARLNYTDTYDSYTCDEGSYIVFQMF
jgi:hypothetical protein